VPDVHFQRRLTLDEQALYRIGVQGRLDERWTDRLAGMRITTSSDETGTVVSTLHGRVRDQSELVGVLISLYELHLPILSVENLTEDT